MSYKLKGTQVREIIALERSTSVKPQAKPATVRRRPHSERDRGKLHQHRVTGDKRRTAMRGKLGRAA